MRIAIRYIFMLGALFFGATGCQNSILDLSEVDTCGIEDTSVCETSTVFIDSTEIFPMEESIGEENWIEEKIEFIYELSSDLGHYYLQMDADTGIEKGEDGTYVIKGDKLYAGTLIISWEQKALLDAGAIMVVTYEGKEVDRITAKLYAKGIMELYDTVVAYHGNDFGSFYYIDAPELTDGIGFYLDEHERLPGCFYQIVLEKDCSLVVTEEIEVDPEDYVEHYYSYPGCEEYEELKKKDWTMKDYYEWAVEKDDITGSLFVIYEAGGAVTKIVEPYRS